VHNIYISLNILINNIKCTPGEITAIVLHELGHAFTWYENTVRTETTNQVLQNISKELFSKKENKDLEFVYRELTDKLKLSKADADSIINSQDKTIMEARVFEAISGFVVSQTKEERYNETSSEQLADQFATRFGYGRELIGGLEKIMKYYNLPEYNITTKSIYILGELAVYAGMISGMLLLMPGALVYALFAVMIGVLSSESNKDMTYDQIKDRYIRVRNELVSILKADIDTKDKTTILTSIYNLDLMIKNLGSYTPLIKYITDLLPGNKAIKSDREYQQLIETISNNNLFVKSAEFEQLTTN
jgi:hypothetical protein